MKTLLISDNKNDWEIIRKMMLANFKDLQLVCVINQADAINAVSSDGPFGFFILDCNMREVDPNELGLELLDFAGTRPILFIGHENVIADRITQQLFTYNEFNDQIFKPLDREDFLIEFRDKITNAMRWAKDEEFEQSIVEADPSEYLPMKIKAFYLYKTFPYDIYLAITSKNYIKIISANKPYTHSTLAAYAKKNVKFLYIQKDDQIKYLDGESLKCIKALKITEPSHNDIYLLQIRSVTILHQYILALGVAPNVLSLMNATIESITKTAKYKQDLGTFLLEYPMFYEGIPSKSIITAYITYALAKKLEWDSELTKNKLTICSILQDITLPDDNMAKINSANSPLLKEYKESDANAFINHPLDAADFSKQFTSYSDIDYVIENHHELPNRKGFPKKPSSSRLTQICAVFNIAQYIASEIDGNKPDNNLFAKTLKTMAKDYGTGSFKEILKLAKLVLRIKV